MHKCLKTLFCLCVLLLLMPAAQAEKHVDKRFYVTYGEAITQDGAQINIVYPYVVNQKIYLFLPAAWDAAALTYVNQDGRSYTVNGEALVSGDPTGAFLPSSTVTLRCDKKKYNMTINVMQGANIPAIFWINQSGNMKRINKDKHHVETGAMAMLYADGKTITAALTQLHGRGNNTAGYPKEGYQFKLDKKKDLLNSGKSKTYILLADYLDYSLLRNRITLDMAAYAGLKNPLSCQSIDLYANGQYMGVHLLTEKAQLNSARIDITNLEDATLAVNDFDLSSARPFKEQLTKYRSIKGYQIANDPADITGGYLLEIEKPYRLRLVETNGFVTQLNLHVVVKEPTKASAAQLHYISDIFNDLHNAINRKDGIDPRSGKHYTEFIDTDSFCIKFWIEEISNNPDANQSSQFFYKDSDLVDSRIYAGPVWDYDLAYGNWKVHGANPSAGFLTKQTGTQYLYCNLYKHADFYQRAKALYFERMQPALQILTGTLPADPSSPLMSLYDYEAQLTRSAQMNSILWRSSVPNMNKAAAGNFHNGVDFLISYLTKRDAYLTKTLLKK